MFTQRVSRRQLGWFLPLLPLLSCLHVRGSSAGPYFAEVGALTNVDEPRLAVDHEGTSHLVFESLPNGPIYAYRTNGEWHTEWVDTPTTTCLNPALALDPSGYPSVVFHDLATNLLRYASRPHGAWVLETIDATNQAAREPSLVFDDQGNPHVCYRTGVIPTLWYARKIAGVWTTEVVDAAPNNGFSCSIALDSQMNPHIAYYEPANTSLRYAKKSGGSWTLSTIDNASTTGLYSKIAIDAEDVVHIAYAEGATTQRIKFATIRQGEIRIVTVDGDSGYSATKPSLALDPLGRPVIAYQRDDDDTIKLARLEAEGWAIESISPLDVGTSFPQLALEPDGHARIAASEATLFYFDSHPVLRSPRGGESWSALSRQVVTWSGLGAVDIELSTNGGASFQTLASGLRNEVATITVPYVSTDQALVRVVLADDPSLASQSPGLFSIVRNLASPWWSKTVASSGDVGEFASLAVDADGQARISYYDTTADDLVYAGKQGVGWATEVVDATGSVGQYTSLALDAGGDPSISYFDPVNGDLKFAKRTNGVWTREIVDATGFTGLYSSLALDAAGNPRISYFDSGNGNLRLASKNGGVWSAETVESAGFVGEYCSLALDAADAPHIAYRDGTNGAAKYARKVGGFWVTEVVDASADAGWFNSLALDALGNPVVSYWDASRFDLHVARRVNGVWQSQTVDRTGDVGWFSSLELLPDGRAVVAYFDNTNDDLKLARQVGSSWSIETLDSTGDVGWHASLALDSEANARVAYFDNGTKDLKYTSTAVEVGDPIADTNLPVGSARLITWDGTGEVDLSLSVDGGSTWQLLASGLTGGEHRLRVPHTPTRFGRFKLDRAVPRSSSATPGLLSIETAIALLEFTGGSSNESRGVALSWSTQPGPDDLGGYRIERTTGGRGWETILPRTRETSYVDPGGGPGSRYRLFAANGLGEEFLLGDIAVRPARPLAAWPLPCRGQELHIDFAVSVGWDGGIGKARLSLVDVSGRRVRSLVEGAFEAGVHHMTWDGRDDNGRSVPSGVYYLRLESGVLSERIKVLRID